MFLALTFEIEADMDQYLDKIKCIYTALLNYFDEQVDPEKKFEDLIQLLKDNNIIENKDDFKLFIKLISKISTNHNRGYDFIEKIEKILQHFKAHIKKSMNDSEIFAIFKESKRIILSLIEGSIIKVDDSFFNLLDTNLELKENYKSYFFPIKQDEDFEAKRKEGENDSYIASLIRNDSIDDFISYVNEKNLRLSSKTIKSSIFETNNFLIEKEPTLMEYAFFYGSIQIINYLMNYKVDLNQSLWIYGIHSNNAEIINLLEENHIPFIFEDCVNEAVKCHHNDIADYFLNNCPDKKIEFDNILECFYFPLLVTEELVKEKRLYDLFNYGYCNIIRILVQNDYFNDINYKIISYN